MRAKIPPINDLWGYKTRRASKNNENWIFANTLFAILIISFSFAFMLIGSIMLICKYIFNSNIVFVGYLIASAIIIPVLPILITEVSLIIKEKRNR